MRIYDRLYEFYGPQGWWPARTPLEIIVGAILTQNTAWRNVEKAIFNLKKANALTSVSAMLKTSDKRLAYLIRPAGYYNVKSRRLKNFFRFLSSGYRSSLRGFSRRKTRILRDELLTVNGIGPETCDSILLYAFGRPVFVVDAYTKRVFSRHDFFKEGSSYDEVQNIFMDNLAPDARLFNEYHALIVRLGKDYCKVRPDCAGCPLHNVKLLANSPT